MRSIKKKTFTTELFAFFKCRTVLIQHPNHWTLSSVHIDPKIKASFVLFTFQCFRKCYERVQGVLILVKTYMRTWARRLDRVGTPCYWKRLHHSYIPVNFAQTTGGGFLQYTSVWQTLNSLWSQISSKNLRNFSTSYFSCRIYISE